MVSAGHQESCSTSGPVSTRMRDHLQAGKPPQYFTKPQGQLSLLTQQDGKWVPASAVTLCGWEVKAGWLIPCEDKREWHVKLCDPSLTRSNFHIWAPYQWVRLKTQYKALHKWCLFYLLWHSKSVLVRLGRKMQKCTKPKSKPTVKELLTCVSISRCTTIMHNTAQNSSDNLLSHTPDRYHSSDAIC